MLISKFQTTNIEIDISLFEKKEDIQIPDQEKRFLRKYNGGETPNTSFKEYDIRGFYGLGDVKYSLNKTGIYCIKEIRYLPCALDSFGNDFCIHLDNGKIFFIDHEQPQNPKEVSEDLRHFIKQTKSEGISPLSLRTPEEREQDFKEKGRAVSDMLRLAWQQEYNKYSSMKLEEVVV